MMLEYGGAGGVGRTHWNYNGGVTISLEGLVLIIQGIEAKGSGQELPTKALSLAVMVAPYSIGWRAPKIVMRIRQNN